MTQQAINLSKGLEAMYFLDSSYYDGQRGVIEDQSGYGRHAEASGGPTIGVEGPDSFEAVSLDGSDDQFYPPFGTQSTWTVVYCLTNYSSSGGLIGDGSVFGRTLYLTGSSGIRYYDEGTEINDFNASTPIAIVGTNGTDTVESYDGYDLIESNNTNGTELDIQSIGGAADRFMAANLSFIGIWSRELSGVEREYLSNLTAPVRSKL